MQYETEDGKETGDATLDAVSRLPSPALYWRSFWQEVYGIS